MPEKKIWLDPVLFDALHLSALANGGIGWGDFLLADEFGDKAPCCGVGHLAALSVDAPGAGVMTRGIDAGLTTWRNDKALRDAGVPRMERVGFVPYCEIVGVDVR